MILGFMKRLIVLGFSIICSISLLVGAPAKPGVVKLIGADGGVVEARLVGDEFHHYYVTEDGVRVDADGVRVAQNGACRAQAMERRKMVRQNAPHQAERGLVILVEFSDLSFVTPRANFDSLLNQVGYSDNGATGSAKDYFRDASNGQYVPHFDVFGPYKLDREMSYYGENDFSGLDIHPDQMVVDAVAKLDSAEDINFADYDTDGNGFIDNIFIYYAGYGENEGAPEYTIWPHAWEVIDKYVEGSLVYDGKKIKGYACTSELRGSSGTMMCGIGTFCHEFGHVLGLPDFYVTDYSSSHKTLGDWDIMDAGAYLNDGNTPPTYSAHERFYLGWLTPELLNVAGEYELKELQESNRAYMVTESGEHNLDGGNPDSTVYYLLENRQKIGWDAYLPGHGLMITKINYNENNWLNNVPNNNKDKQGCDLIEADGITYMGEYGKPGDLFPGTASVTSYKFTEKYAIDEIEEKGDVLEFMFDVKTDDVDVDDEECSGLVLVTSGAVCVLSGVAQGAVVECYDAVGRRLWAREADSESVVFEKPSGVYLLRIIENNTIEIIKGV